MIMKIKTKLQRIRDTFYEHAAVAFVIHHSGLHEKFTSNKTVGGDKLAWPHLNRQYTANKEPHGAGAFSGAGHMGRQTAGEGASEEENRRLRWSEVIDPVLISSYIAVLHAKR